MIRFFIQVIGSDEGRPSILLNDTPLATLQAWSIKEFLSDHASVLPSRFDEANFALYGKLLQGTPISRK